ncbi:hypothetical protein HTZ84_06530 [Haloterrigena sp. SYSU A558-1]|uniref:C2H2-type domain-containing protein n=1 Tax=Haloterrigena gelatinilytica TaxID=2741724 RepID=A0A8J8KIF0_9EURY|nr:hypothetical protein [Haloterrigena gelatinilytica]NUB92204.1 hypothetical protein [Haloterrigena gelatinilytica]NUC71966.1 hypothetical protein [Haloterrigena gelatinilytica]
MTGQHTCPLCADAYDDRTSLRVHLEVEHRKSEIVAEFVDLHDAGAGGRVDGDPTVVGEDRQAPSAD